MPGVCVMLIHWLCLMIKTRQLKICLDTQVYSSKLECSAVANWSKVRYKRVGNIFYTGLTMHTEFQAQTHFNCFLFFFRSLCVDIHVIPCLSFIALVQRRPWYMYNFICEYSLFSSPAWLFTCAVSVYGFMPCSGILFNSYNNFIQFKQQGIN